ncbi:MAG: sortase [Ardenticatenia bacterium]|nr:sortase [Ardenticatenia bacterium]
MPPTPVAPATPDSTPTPTVAAPPVRIAAPAIGLDAPVVPVTGKRITVNGDTIAVWEVASQAAGWHENSATPGMAGNVVLSGHHDKEGEVFRYVVDLEPGDTVTLYTEERPYTYSVETRVVVRDKGMPEETRRENPLDWLLSRSAGDPGHLLALQHEHPPGHCRFQAGTLTRLRPSAHALSFVLGWMADALHNRLRHNEAGFNTVGTTFVIFALSGNRCTMPPAGGPSQGVAHSCVRTGRLADS